MPNIAIFCGSKIGKNPAYESVAKELGKVLAQKQWSLVYGGGNIGLMGVIADSVLENQGEVIGVIPGHLKELELAHLGVTRLIETPDMHQRKKTMYELASAFIALPGGIGTMDEFCEIATWYQLGLHNAPCIIFNYNGFYDHFVAHLKKLFEEGFLSEQDLKAIEVVNTVAELKELLENRYAFV